MSTGTGTSKRTWLEEFMRRDDARWPGPRPLVEAESQHLKGRNDDASAFLAEVVDHLLVVLTADSGVGKSSLLRTRLMPDLSKAGFLPVLVDDWNIDSYHDGQTTLDSWLEGKVRESPSGSLLTPSDSGGFWRDLSSDYGPVVLILDQFEELIRYSPSRAKEALAWLQKVNSDSLRVVVSLRVEYSHHLRETERRVRPFTMATFRLEEVSRDVDIMAIVSDSKREASGGPPFKAVSGTFAKAVKSLWEDEREAEEGVGLLDLQALLYELHHRNPEEELTEDHVGEFERMAAAGGLSPFRFALRAAIKRKLDHCRDATLESGDTVLALGSEALVHRILPMLSSGGYKLLLEQASLIDRVLPGMVRLDDSKHLREIYHAAHPSDLATTIIDDLKCPWPDHLPDELIMGRPAELFRQSDEWHGRDWVPWETDERDASSGSMIGMSLDGVLYQECRLFHHALAWLEACKIVRRSHFGDRTRLALIHDRFAGALEPIDDQQISRARPGTTPRLGGEWVPSMAHLAARLTSSWGEEVVWVDDDEQEGGEEGVDRPARRNHLEEQVLVNLRWRDCLVRDASFIKVTFVNCDLRGTRFGKCQFEGATFVNCLLDNVAFERCTVRGASPWLGREVKGADVEGLSKEGDRSLPDFTVGSDARVIDAIRRYRSVPKPPGADGDAWVEYADGTMLYSRTSGVAALPARGKDPKGVKLDLAAGGLAVYGGRLYSLVFVATLFEGRGEGKADQDIEKGTLDEGDEGALSLRHITGASLDLVEHLGGRLQIVDSVIRGLTITSPPTVEAGRDEALGGSEIDIISSVMANTWIGEEVKGTFDCRDSILVQLVNLTGGTTTVSADPADNVLVGVVPLVSDLHKQYTDALTNPEGAPATPVPSLTRMDYLRQPARQELQVRPDHVS